MYKTELHCHSAEVSLCGKIYSDEIVSKYVEAGYTTVCLTNHFSESMFKHKRLLMSDVPWDEKVDYFMHGYHELCRAAEGKLNIILGIEMRFQEDGANDYLLIGITEEFLRSNPDILDKGMKFASQRFRDAGMLIIQAHPFRDGMKIMRPEYIDGIEIYNGHIGHDSRNDVARHWAEKFDLIRTSGTDTHRSIHIPCGGILTEEPILTSEQLLDTLKSGRYELICDGTVPK